MAERIPNTNVPSAAIQGPGRLRGIARTVTPRIEPPVIRVVPPPVTTVLQSPVLRTPELEIIQYEEFTIRPEVRRGVGGVGGNNNSEEEEAEDSRDMPLPPLNTQQPVITVPIIGEIPVPPVETVVLSGTTAVATVTAALIGKDVANALLKWMKPLVKQTMLKLKKALKGDLTPYETQELLVFEGEKKLTKRLKAEQKAEKLRQSSVHRAPLRQRIQMRMEKKDGSRPQP